MPRADWLEQHLRRSPPALAARVREYAAGEAGDGDPDHLGRAAVAALGRVLAHPGDRSAALDLLAADALVTLALLGQAQLAPERLDALAVSLLGGTRPDA
jgi:hypothetical protein